MKFQNCPRNFKHPEFSPIFSSIFPEILSRNEKLSSYRICPKLVSRIKIPILPKKKIQASWKTFLRNSLEHPNFEGNTKTFPKFPQAARTF
jgi:hypothetical protein